MTGRERAGTARFAPARSGLPSGPVRSLLSGPAGDIIAAAVLTGLFLLASGHNGPPKGGRAVDAIGDALLVLAGLSVALCRRYPRTALILVTIVLGCYLGRRCPDGPVYLAGMLTVGRVTVLDGPCSSGSVSTGRPGSVPRGGLGRRHA